MKLISVRKQASDQVIGSNPSYDYVVGEYLPNRYLVKLNLGYKSIEKIILGNKEKYGNRYNKLKIKKNVNFCNDNYFHRRRKVILSLKNIIIINLIS